jgi:pimeloyl-ACP methyl ester carboxylesterase
MADDRRVIAAPIILVPGFWLGAWAWDQVAETLRADGHEVTALTLPGLESPEADRSGITLSDHVDTIVEAVRAAQVPVLLAVHSASGFSGYAASDRVPERIAAMVYVDSAPGKGALDPAFDSAEKPLDWGDIPTTIICTGFPSEQIRAAVVEHDWAWLGGVAELRDVTWVDLPTSHWPMWSRPDELAAIIGDLATAAGGTR